MKIFGIICEYDPLHLGHARLINHAKNIAGKDGMVLCIMSGNFVQRGLPSILNKFCRAKHAILAGADAVIELPTLFATASASDFALGGVKILNQLKADTLICGSECGDKNVILSLAQFLFSPSEKFNAIVRNHLEKGQNYPTALSFAEKEIYGSNILNSPNNLLSIEYAKAILATNSNLSFETLKRDSDFLDENNFDNCSSSVIRKAFLENNLDKVKHHLPEYVFNDLKNLDKNYLKKYQDFIPLYMATKTKKQVEEIADVIEGLNNYLIDNLDSNYEKYISNLKTKRYTRARLNRILLYSILNITKNLQMFKYSAELPINLLAIKNDKRIIGEIKRRTNTDLTQEKLQYITEINQLTENSDKFYYTMYDIVIDKNKINKLNKY